MIFPSFYCVSLGTGHSKPSLLKGVSCGMGLWNCSVEELFCGVKHLDGAQDFSSKGPVNMQTLPSLRDISTLGYA